MVHGEPTNSFFSSYVWRPCETRQLLPPSLRGLAGWLARSLGLTNPELEHVSTAVSARAVFTCSNSPLVPPLPPVRTTAPTHSCTAPRCSNFFSRNNITGPAIQQAFLRGIPARGSEERQVQGKQQAGPGSNARSIQAPGIYMHTTNVAVLATRFYSARVPTNNSHVGTDPRLREEED